MIAPRHQAFVWVALPFALSWLTLALLDPDVGSGIRESIGLGYFFGSLFGHTTLVAAWAAFGPGPLLWRMPLSLLWIVLLAVAIAMNIAMNGGPAAGAYLLGACLLGQWLALQLPLWGLKAGLRLHLQHSSDLPREFSPQEWQFGIRQLLIVTTMFAVIFGVGRLIVANLPNEVSLARGEGQIFVFLVAAAIFLTLPLVLAGLMQRGSLAGISLALALIGVGTYVEWPLLTSVRLGPGPKFIDLISINAFSAAFILLIVLTLRLSGYRLVRYARP